MKKAIILKERFKKNGRRLCVYGKDLLSKFQRERVFLFFPKWKVTGFKYFGK